MAPGLRLAAGWKEVSKRAQCQANRFIVHYRELYFGCVSTMSKHLGFCESAIASCWFSELVSCGTEKKSRPGGDLLVGTTPVELQTEATAPVADSTKQASA
jgi:hypothetical protein